MSKFIIREDIIDIPEIHVSYARYWKLLDLVNPETYHLIELSSVPSNHIRYVDSSNHSVSGSCGKGTRTTTGSGGMG
jgi:hypothetical protein